MRETLSPFVPCSAYFTIKCSSPVLQSCGSGVQECDPAVPAGSPALPVPVPLPLCGPRHTRRLLGWGACPALCPGLCRGSQNVYHEPWTFCKPLRFSLFLGPPTPCRGSPAWSGSSVAAAVALPRLAIASPRNSLCCGSTAWAEARPCYRFLVGDQCRGRAGKGGSSGETAH